MIIKSLNDLLPDILELQKNLALNGRQVYVEAYRGQSKDEYLLVPGISRNNYSLEETLKREKVLTQTFFDSINNNKIDFIQNPYPANDAKYQKEWFYLFQGQHLGLNTRLIDWSISWETALLFAVEDERDFGINGQFWIYLFPKQNFIYNANIRDIYKINPLDIDRTYLINQPFYQSTGDEDFIAEQRRIRQSGRFTIQPSDKIRTPIENQPELRNNIFKYVIDGASKRKIKAELLERIHPIDWKYYKKSNNIDGQIKKYNQIMK